MSEPKELEAGRGHDRPSCRCGLRRTVLSACCAGLWDHRTKSEDVASAGRGGTLGQRDSIYRKLYDQSGGGAKSEMAKTLLADWLEMARGHKSWRGVQAYLAVVMPEEYGEIRRTQVDVREGSRRSMAIPGLVRPRTALRERWRVLFPERGRQRCRGQAG